MDERNFTAPRLTELSKLGVVEPVGKDYCQFTGKKVSLYKLRDEATDAGTAWEEPPSYHRLDVPGLLLFDVMSLWICGKFYAALDWVSDISARIRSWARSRK